MIPKAGSARHAFDRPEQARRRGDVVDVYDQISTGAMPPKRKPRPPVDASMKVQGTLKSSLVAVDLAKRNADQGRVILRRLNRNEYQNTIQDLLGIEAELKDILPEDTSSMGSTTSRPR